MGDVDGDGFDDVLLADLTYFYFSPAVLVFGDAGGFAKAIDLDALGDKGVHLTASGRYDGGYAVGAAGDLNGDGISSSAPTSPTRTGARTRDRATSSSAAPAVSMP